MQGPRREKGPAFEDLMKNSFYIKTFQVFNTKGVAVSAPILTEQVFGNYESHRLYDTSILCRGSKLYYWKRIYVNPAVEEDEDLLSMDPGLDEQDEGMSAYSRTGFKKQRANESSGQYDVRLLKALERQVIELQLFSYDIVTR